MHDRTRFNTPEILPDALGGVSLSHLPPHVRLDGPGITALTVDNAPALEALDLRHCPAGLHLYLSNVPALQRVVLPAQAPGAVVHLAADDTPTLKITGAIDELDACWPGFAFRLADVSRAPWDGAEVTATNPTTDSEALILTAAADLTTLPRVTGRVRDLFLLGTSGAGASLDLRSARHLEAAQVHGADGIAELRVPTGLHALTLENCTGLERLKGAGRNLQLRACRGEDCLVDGVWNHALVDRADVDRLAMPLVEWLEVRNAARGFALEQGEDAAVTIVGRPPRLTGGPRHRCTRNVGSATAGLIARVAGGDPEAREQLAWALTRPGGRRDWLERLQALAAAAGDVDPGLLWRYRCLAHAVHNGAAPEAVTLDGAWYHSGERWSWRFPSDLAREGWACDLRLFAAASDRPETEPFQTPLRATCAIPQLAAVADVVSQSLQRGHKPLPVFVDTLRAGLPAVARRRSRQHRRLDTGQLESLLRGAVLISDTGAARALHRLARETLGPAARLGLLRTLAAHGLVQARAELWALARNTRELDERQRELALKGALAPPRFGTFAAAGEVPA